jgi:hypothetical protein
MPIDVRQDYVTKSVIEDLTDEEINQIWAEAYQLYLAGEPLYLIGDEDVIAKQEQSKHAEQDERKGIIEEYLDKLFPDNWSTMDLYDRRHWLDDPLAKIGSVQKNYACIAEIWCECLGKDKTDMTRYNTREINDILKALPNWEFCSSTKQFPIYGTQKYYRRKDELM